jgi:hypothetical protein
MQVSVGHYDFLFRKSPGQLDLPDPEKRHFA